MNGVEKLSEVQEMILAILPIPSALLSIIGSSVIIYVAIETRKQQSWTPYTRLLLAMSISDILFSVTIAVAAFLRPQETSKRIWAFGTDASCSAIGFLNQMSTSAILYNGMLSLYFLLTARFGFKNAYIAKRIEPWMHCFAILYPLITATVGAVEGAYGEMSVNGLVCWVVSYPRNCGDGPGESGEECASMVVAWLFYGLPVVLTLAALIINNLIIITFVRKQTRPRKARRRNSSSHRRQQHRLKLVSTQASLFVASFAVCIIWSGIMNSAETLAESEEDELKMILTFYPVSIIQAILLPLQGLLNMVVYIRPKFLKARHENPKETRTWAAKRSIFGDGVKPTNHGTETLSPGTPVQRKKPVQKEMQELLMPDITSGSDEMQQPQSNGNNGSSDASTHAESNTSNASSLAATTPLPQDMISSLTASLGDFDHILEEDEEDERWVDDNRKSWVPMGKAPRFKSSLDDGIGSSLEVISELSESVFESIKTPPGVIEDKSPAPLLSPDQSESRWSSSYKEKKQSVAASTPLSIPRRVDSDSELASDIDSPVSAPTRTLSPQSFSSPPPSLIGREGESKVDSPVTPPRRRLSPPLLAQSEDYSDED